MDYRHMTAPCGLDCFNCIGYRANKEPDLLSIIAEALEIPLKQAELAVCKGCRNQKGRIPFSPSACRVYPCAEDKNVTFCFECSQFPCDYLHPYADQATKVPHNTKVFNLCLIRKMGVDIWARDKAKAVKETYFHAPWKL